MTGRALPCRGIARKCHIAVGSAVVPLDAHDVAPERPGGCPFAPFRPGHKRKALGSGTGQRLAGQGLRQGARHVSNLFRGQFRVHGQR